ncbi:MAG: hypothetical protein JW909_03760 [Planctomycetes bacterium]|nr:hypothetical protein [Planctomycetota bacterium]
MEQSVRAGAIVRGEDMREAMAAMLLIGACLPAACEETMPAAESAVRSLVLNLQKTGPAEAEYVVKSGETAIAVINIVYAHPVLKMATVRGDETSELWVAGADSYSREGKEGLLVHRDYREARRLADELEKKLESVFNDAAANNMAGTGRTLKDAWNANSLRIAQIGAVADVYFMTMEGELCDAGGYAHMDPSPICAFGWFTYPEGVEEVREGEVSVSRGNTTVVIETATGWPQRVEWRSGGRVTGVMERTAFRKVKTTGPDLLPPAWERQAAIEGDAYRKSDLARIVSMPLWMYVMAVSQKAGNDVPEQAVDKLRGVAFAYYGAMLDSILGKDFIVEAAAVFEQEVSEKVEELGRPAGVITAADAKVISDKIDGTVVEIIDRQGRMLARQGYTGVDFLMQAMGGKPPNSLSALTQAALQGFSGAYNSRIGKPVHGLVRWHYREYWLAPAIGEEERLKEKAEEGKPR